MSSETTPNSTPQQDPEDPWSPTLLSITTLAMQAPGVCVLSGRKDVKPLVSPRFGALHYRPCWSRRIRQTLRLRPAPQN